MSIYYPTVSSLKTFWPYVIFSNDVMRTTKAEMLLVDKVLHERMKPLGLNTRC